jgi:hypothetical protein
MYGTHFFDDGRRGGEALTREPRVRAPIMDCSTTFQRDPYRLRAGLKVDGPGRPALFIDVSQSDSGLVRL